MSANSDSAKLIGEARDLGFDVVRLKHGGYGVYAGNRLVTRIPTHSGPAHWVRRVRRDLDRAA